MIVTALTLATACGGSSSEVGPGGATEGASSSSSSGGAGTQSSHGGSGTAGSQCVQDDGCPLEAPLCLGGWCEPCDAADDPNAACSELSASHPICDAGRCVACTDEEAGVCGGDTPICGDDQRCVSCAAHDECAVACELDTGRCIDRLIVVGPDETDDANDVATALASIDEGESAAILIETGDTCNVGPWVVPAGARVAFLGPDVGMACLTAQGDEPVVDLPEGGAAYLWRVRIENAVGPALQGRGASLWLQRSEVVNNQGGGLLFSQGSWVVVENSVVGGDRNHVPAVSVRDSELEIAYATLAAGFGEAVALSCSGDVSVDVRNSILVAESTIGEVDCSDAVIVRSALESAFGSGNVAVGVVDTAAWFQDFTGGDLHLRSEAATMFDGVAQWSPGDPVVDLDGDPRPTGEDGDREDWAGADIPGAP
jgi:hypothetical protein